MTVGLSLFALACVRESVADSRYGHDDISCMTYDIHVDISCMTRMKISVSTDISVLGFYE